MYQPNTIGEDNNLIGSVINMNWDTLCAILFNPFGVVILFWIGMALYSWWDNRKRK